VLLCFKSLNSQPWDSKSPAQPKFGGNSFVFFCKLQTMALLVVKSDKKYSAGLIRKNAPNGASE
jgi:hypothetical protein